MASATVSVLIATYNRAAMLEEAVGSVWGQTLPPLEIVIADDGSTDDTASRVAAMEGPIRYLRLAHSGRPSVVYNQALEAARGDLVAFLNDDDLWLPDKLARQVARIESDEGTGFVYHDARFLYPSGRLSEPLLPPGPAPSGHLLAALIQDCFIAPSSILARRALLTAVGGFDERITGGEDYDLWLRLAAITRGDYVDAPLVTLRHHAAQMSRSRQVEDLRSAIAVLEATGQRAPLDPATRRLLDQTVSRHHVTLARRLLALGERGAARRHLGQALRRDPRQRGAWRTLPAALRP